MQTPVNRLAIVLLPCVCACADTAPENQPPTIADTIPDLALLNGRDTTITLSRHFTDPDGDPLSFGVESHHADVVNLSIERDVLKIVALRPPSTLVRVSATDPDSAQATQEFRVTVKSPPTIADSIPDLAMLVDSTRTITLSRHFRDPDGDPLTYGVESRDPDAVRVSITDGVLAVMGLRTSRTGVRVWATDPDSAQATQEFQVRVTSPPTIADSIPDHILEVTSDTVIHLWKQFADPDGDELAYSARSSELVVAGVSIKDSTLAIAAQHVPATSAITVSATDGVGRVSQSFKVTLNPPRAAWREDFDSTLTGWKINERRGETTIEVEDGALRISLLSDNSYTIATRDSVVEIEDSWTVSADMRGMEDDQLCAGLAVLTGDADTPGWMFRIAYYASIWRFLYHRAELGENTWIIEDEGEVSLPEEGDYVRASITLASDILTFVVDNKVMVSVDLEELWDDGEYDDDWPTGITGVRLDALNTYCKFEWNGESDAVYDWVEIGSGN